MEMYIASVDISMSSSELPLNLSIKYFTIGNAVSKKVFPFLFDNNITKLFFLNPLHWNTIE